MVAAGYQPERAAVRGGGLRDADHLGSLGRARDDPAYPAARILLVDGAAEVLAALGRAEGERKAIGDAGRRRVLGAHTAAHRAQTLDMLLREAGRRPGRRVGLRRNARIAG